MVLTIVLVSILLAVMYALFIALCRTSSRATGREIIAHDEPRAEMESASRKLHLERCEIGEPTVSPAKRRTERSSEPLVV